MILPLAPIISLHGTNRGFLRFAQSSAGHPGAAGARKTRQWSQILYPGGRSDASEEYLFPAQAPWERILMWGMSRTAKLPANMTAELYHQLSVGPNDLFSRYSRAEYSRIAGMGMNADLTPIKQIPILEIASRLQIAVRGTKAMCFSGHDNQTASLNFWPANNSWKCFGACGKGGDGISLVMEVLACPFQGALDWFATEFYVDVRGQKSRRRAEPHRVRIKAVARASKAPQSHNEKNSDFIEDPEVYQWLINRCGYVAQPRGMEYLKSHGIPLSVAEQFGVRELRSPGRAFQCLVQEWGNERVYRSGLAWGDGGVAKTLIWKSYAILFPFFSNGGIPYIQARLFSGDAKFLGLKGIGKPLFNSECLQSLKAGARVHICEGIPDALALEAYDRHAVAVLGASSFRREWVDQFMAFDVVLMPDADKAGDQFKRTIMDCFRARGKSVQAPKLPLGRDVADMLAEKRGKR